MLKKFFMNVLSSFVGAWLAILLSAVTFFILLFGIIGIVMSKSINIEKDSILKISLSGDLVERETPVDLNLSTLLSGDFEEYQSVETLVTALNEAKTNDKIKAVYLECGALGASPASAHAVREAVADFKTSGKKVIAYADTYSQASYYVATAADSIFLNPAGAVDLHGIGGQNLFFKDFFDKIGVEFQAVRVGEGKSAIEPYTQPHMSEYARRQSMELLDTLWANFSGQLAESRGLNRAEIDSLISKDFISMRIAQVAKDRKLVDGLCYRHEAEERVSRLCGQEKPMERVVEPSQLASISEAWNSANNYSDNQIAVVYACGEIDGMPGINSRQTVAMILELAEDENVKGMVLRVNSPGGSAFGSEQIWEAVETFKKKNKKVAVSMGDYAASGGYYISCGANQIFADRYTVTGSIGIFGLIPNISGLLDKIGINTETVATNPQALFPSLVEPLTPEQQAAMQDMVNDGYELFVKRCAEGRNLPVADIKAIADGRPLSAQSALQLKLIDQIGSLQEAIEWTAKQLKLGDDYSVGVYPVYDGFMNMILYSDFSAKISALSSGMSKDYIDRRILEVVRSLLGNDRIRASYTGPSVKV